MENRSINTSARKVSSFKETWRKLLYSEVVSSLTCSSASSSCPGWCVHAPPSCAGFSSVPPARCWTRPLLYSPPSAARTPPPATGWSAPCFPPGRRAAPVRHTKHTHVSHTTDVTIHSTHNLIRFTIFCSRYDSLTIFFF